MVAEILADGVFGVQMRLNIEHGTTPPPPAPCSWSLASPQPPLFYSCPDMVCNRDSKLDSE